MRRSIKLRRKAFRRFKRKMRRDIKQAVFKELRKLNWPMTAITVDVGLPVLKHALSDMLKTRIEELS